MSYFDPEIRVLVAHSVPLVAAGLTAILQLHGIVVVPGTGLAGTRGDSESAGRGNLAADLVLADYDNGLIALGAHRFGRDHADGKPKLLIVSTDGSECEIRSALENGAHGYVNFRCGPDEVIAGIRTLIRGQRYLCTKSSQTMADTLVHASLTSRETDVLRLVVRGYCNKTIGRDLDITVSTVKAHVRAILDKLGATSRTEAASLAARRGLLRTDILLTSLRGEGAHGRARPASRNRETVRRHALAA